MSGFGQQLWQGSWAERVGRWSGLAALLLALCVADVAAGYIRVEVTFDDEVDGAGAQNGYPMVDNLRNDFSMLGQGYLAVELTGTARRSAFEEGRYGRAAELDGQGAIRIHDWVVTDRLVTTVGMWVKARDRSAGRLFHVQDTGALSLFDGELGVEVWNASGEIVVLPTGIRWPADGAFHYLTITLSLNAVTTLVGLTVALDFEVRAQLHLPLQLPLPGAAITVGDGFTGLIDELRVLGHAPHSNDYWDLDPNAECPEGLTCLEEVIELVPNGFTHRAPLRMKSMVDAAACNADSPCPLLLLVSGGGICADDYAPWQEVEYYAREGFVAVTPDPYCEAGGEFSGYPMETSQLVAAKNHLMSASPHASRIDGPEYAATGCSHGCGSVTNLMVFEEDHPHRTFGNSCSWEWIYCAYATGALCRATEEHLEQYVVDLFGSLDWEHPLAQLDYGQTQIAALTPELAATREYALSWGLNLEGDDCDAEGRSICYEESMWGMTYGSRRIRDLWQRFEPQGAPTGYFVENSEANCQHCATVGSAAFACGACLLKHGRLGMAEACPECLAYDDASIDHGADALECPAPASWYLDPLTLRTDVGIDVRPASEANLLILSSPAPFPLAILGSETVDVDDLDPASLALGPLRAAPLLDLAIPWVYRFSRWDVNQDGWPDLVAWFVAADTGLAPGATDLCLKGKIEGTDFEACDAVFAVQWACGLGVELLLVLLPLAGIRVVRRRS